MSKTTTITEQALAHTVGERLRELRTKRQLSSEGVSDGAGVARRVYSKWENGQGLPTLRLMLRVANFYGVHPAELLQ